MTQELFIFCTSIKHKKLGTFHLVSLITKRNEHQATLHIVPNSELQSDYSVAIVSILASKISSPD